MAPPFAVSFRPELCYKPGYEPYHYRHFFLEDIHTFRRFQTQRSDSSGMKRLNFCYRKLHFQRSPNNTDCNAVLRRVALCVRCGARKRSDAIRKTSY